MPALEAKAVWAMGVRVMIRADSKLTDKPVRMLLSYTPGGFEQWFLEIGTSVGDPNEQPPAVMPADIRKAVQTAENTA